MARPYFPEAKMNAIIATLGQRFDVIVSPEDEREAKNASEYLVNPKKSDPSDQNKSEIWGNYGSHIHLVFERDPAPQDKNAPGYRIKVVVITLRPRDMRRTVKGVPDISTNSIHFHYSNKAVFNSDVDDADRKNLITYVTIAADVWVQRFKDLSEKGTPVSDKFKGAWTPLTAYASGGPGIRAKKGVADLLHGILVTVRDSLNTEYGGDWSLEWDK